MSEKIEEQKGTQEKKKWKLQFAWFPVLFVICLDIFIGDFYPHNSFTIVFFIIILGMLLTIFCKKFPLKEIFILALFEMPFSTLNSGDIAKIFIFLFYIIVILIIGAVIGLIILKISELLKLRVTISVFVNKKILHNRNFGKIQNVFKVLNYFLSMIILFYLLYIIAFNYKILIILVFILGLLQFLISSKYNYLRIVFYFVILFLVPVYFSNPELSTCMGFWVILFPTFILGIILGFKLNKYLEESIIKQVVSKVL